jgi:hypothetical protein
MRNNHSNAKSTEEADDCDGLQVEITLIGWLFP